MRWLAILVVAACASAPAPAPIVPRTPNTGAIMGQVKTAGLERAPIHGVTVTATGPRLDRPRSTITDERGNYALSDLPPGDGYRLTFNYEQLAVERRGVVVRDGVPTPIFQALNVTLPSNRIRDTSVPACEPDGELCDYLLGRHRPI
jgi:carboxypeptidase family protein